MNDKPDDKPDQPDDSASGAAQNGEQREEPQKPVSTVVPGADFAVKPRITPSQG